MRSASRPASPRKWVASTMVRPCSVASEPMSSTTSRVRGGVEPGRGLVEEQDLGVVEEGPGQAEPLALTGGRAPHGLVGALGHAEAVSSSSMRASTAGPRSPRMRAA